MLWTEQLICNSRTVSQASAQWDQPWTGLAVSCPLETRTPCSIPPWRGRGQALWPIKMVLSKITLVQRVLWCLKLTIKSQCTAPRSMFETTFQTFSIPVLHLAWMTKEPESLFRCLTHRWVKYLKPKESNTLTKCSRSCRERLMDSPKTSMNYFRIHPKAATNKVGWRNLLREANKSKQFRPLL